MANETLSLAKLMMDLSLANSDKQSINEAKKHLLDTIGVLIFGRQSTEMRNLFSILDQRKQGTCSGQDMFNYKAFGYSEQFSCHEAILLNAAMAHCYEIDDIHNQSAICLGGLIIPTLLTLCETENFRGSVFLEAMLAGYEVSARIGRAINAPNLFSMGWWPTAICGAFGTAAGAAKLFGLSESEIISALGLSGMFSGGLLVSQHGDLLARHILYGETALRGFKAVEMVRRGVLGPEKILEMPGGFCFAFGSNPQFDVLTSHDEKLEINNTSIKPYGCARQTHAALDGISRLMHNHNLSVEDLSEIQIFLPEQAMFFDNPEPPRTRARALASIQFTIALLLSDKEINPMAFENKIFDVKILDLMKIIKVFSEPALNIIYPSSWPANIKFYGKNGKSYKLEIKTPKGDSLNPLSWDEVSGKFRSLTADILKENKVAAIINIIENFDESDTEYLLDILKQS